jgi:hypothetical protein
MRTAPLILPPPVFTEEIVADADAIAALLEQMLGPLGRPITHFKCLLEPRRGRVFLEEKLYDALPFVKPILSWKAFGYELDRLRRELNSSTVARTKGKYIGWEISQLKLGTNDGIGISVYPIPTPY